MSIDPVYAFGEAVPARGSSPPEPPIVNEYEGQVVGCFEIFSFGRRVQESKRVLPLPLFRC